MSGWLTSTGLSVNTAQPPLATGRYYSNSLITTVTTLAMTINTLYAIPIYVSTPSTFTSINIEVTSFATGNAHLGIYADAGGFPGALLLDAGAVSVGTPNGAKSLVISKFLSPGWYWLAIVSSSTATVRACSQTTCLPWLGFTSGLDTTYHTGWSVAFTYGALPNPFTPGGALMAGAPPRVMLGL